MDKCREAFERHQAKLLNMSYEELKSQFGYQSQVFGTRYAAGSDFDKEFVNWEASWQARQAEVDDLNASLRQGLIATAKASASALENLERAKQAEFQLNHVKALLDEKDKRIESTLLQLSGFLRLVEEDLICEEAVARVVISNIRRLEKALRGDDDINVTR